MIRVFWIDHDSKNFETRFRDDQEFAAIKFEESLEAEGLECWRVMPDQKTDINV